MTIKNVPEDDVRTKDEIAKQVVADALMIDPDDVEIKSLSENDDGTVDVVFEAPQIRKPPKDLPQKMEDALKENEDAPPFNNTEVVWTTDGRLYF